MITTPWAARFGFGLLLWFAATVAAFAQSAPTIFYASESVTVNAGQSAGFYVSAEGNPTPTFQWQRLPAGSASWANLSEVGAYSGTSTDNLSIAVTTVAMNGDQFRCVAINAAGSDTSSGRTLTITPSGAILPVNWPVPRILAPTVSVNRNPSGTTGRQSVVVQSVARPPTGMKSSSAASSRVVVKLRNSPAQSLALAMSSTTGAVKMATVPMIDRNLASLLSKHSVRAASPLFAGNVRAKRQQGRSEAQLTTAMRQRFPLRSARGPVRATPPDLSSTYVFELGERSATEVTETVRSLRADANVLYAEEDRLVHVSYLPNDPSYSSTGTWGQAYDDLYGLKKIGTTQAWDVTHGQGVVVAVIDTGVDYNHPDISGNIWINPGEISGNGIDDDNNGFIDDMRGWDFVGQYSSQPAADNDPFDGHFHGTHVAGTIAATGNNGLGVVGVAWQAKVMAVKGLDDNGSGYESDLAKAIVYAVDNGADVINASWGGAGFSQTETEAIEYAHANGVVFVAAAGNSASNANDFTPANVSNAIAVSSLDPYDNLSYFSNFGTKVELAAPGEDILSLEAGTSGYTRHSGTSMAAPHVSGVAALIIAQHPTYSNEQVRQALRASATDLGVMGKDSSFGYGRVNAAQGVLVNQALEAKILGLTDGTKISAPLALTGSAGGLGFDHYVVDYGAGATPTTWTTLRSSTASVANESIGTMDPSALPDGIYTIRLRVFSTGGLVFSDQIQIEVDYLEITSPLPPPVPSLTQEVKPGTAFQITGTAKGPSFQNYRLEWALGAAATSGWSTVGFSLDGDGEAPVTDGLLGSWTLPVTLDGYYTIRLTVTNNGFSSIATTSVYAEPALISSGWPKFVGPAYYNQSAVPVGQPDGTTRLVLCGTYAPLFCYSLGLDGSMRTVPLGNGSMVQPSVGNLDGQPGDEIVVADGTELKILSSDLALIRSIALNPGRRFSYDRVSLIDLDNDGVPEIIAPVRNQSFNTVTNEQIGEIYVYRTDGTFFSENPPPVFSTHWVAETRVVAVDLNGDGRKEIVVAFDSADQKSYTLEAFNADGSSYTGWGPLLFSNRSLRSLAAANLDGDDAPELVIAEADPTDGSVQVRVINHTGTVRPGWPVTVESNYYGIEIAIGDLDRDQRNEIVAVTQSKISVLRGDGVLWSTPWSSGGNPPWNVYAPPLIADINSDGFPEILVGKSVVDWYSAAKPFRHAALTCYNRDGTILKSWPLFGVEGQQPFLATPLVGDFNGDGLSDLAVNVGLVAGGQLDGWLLDSAITCLNTGTAFNALGSDWISNLHDPQNSRSAVITVPTITTQPTSQSVFAGNAVTFVGGANGDPLPAFQWKKNGVDIPGATRGKLTFSSALLSDTGSYTLVVTNLKGSATSNPATLTVNKATPVIIWPVPAPITYGTALSGTQLNATASAVGTFVYSPTRGAVLNAGRHTLNVSFTPADLVNFYEASFQRSVIVNLASGAPLFLVQPVSKSIPIGASVTVTAEASAMTAPTYQWQKNGVAIIGATGSSYTIPRVLEGDAGNYTVVATNSVDAATSNVAVLTTFTAAPSDAVISFTVE